MNNTLSIKSLPDNAREILLNGHDIAGVLTGLRLDMDGFKEPAVYVELMTNPEVEQLASVRVLINSVDAEDDDTLRAIRDQLNERLGDTRTNTLTVGLDVQGLEPVRQLLETLAAHKDDLPAPVLACINEIVSSA